MGRGDTSERCGCGGTGVHGSLHRGLVAAMQQDYRLAGSGALGGTV